MLKPELAASRLAESLRLRGAVVFAVQWYGPPIGGGVGGRAAEARPCRIACACAADTEPLSHSDALATSDVESVRQTE